MRVLAIKRKEQFSPNHVGNDTAILNAVCAVLEQKGVVVQLCDEIDFLEITDIDQNFIINMGRSKAALSKLMLLEEMGKVVINSPRGIQQCFRKNMTLALLANAVPYPASVVVPTADAIAPAAAALGGNAWWLKRGDFHAIHREDVSFASSVEEAQSILSEFAHRGIAEAVVSEHLAGDLVKFYAVKDTDFFHWFYPYEHNHHKYAIYEQINGGTLHYPFKESALKDAAQRAAETLGVAIYGGDAIISPNGELHIIDLNDWPSFAPCRDEASVAIAEFLFKQIQA